jgi:hypothetical protein
LKGVAGGVTWFSHAVPHPGATFSEALPEVLEVAAVGAASFAGFLGFSRCRFGDL